MYQPFLERLIILLLKNESSSETQQCAEWAISVECLCTCLAPRRGDHVKTPIIFSWSLEKKHLIIASAKISRRKRDIPFFISLAIHSCHSHCLVLRLDSETNVLGLDCMVLNCPLYYLRLQRISLNCWTLKMPAYFSIHSRVRTTQYKGLHPAT